MRHESVMSSVMGSIESTCSSAVVRAGVCSSCQARSCSSWQHCGLLWRHFPFMTLLMTLSWRAPVILASN